MRGIIDRFENEYAVVEFEGRQMQNIAKKLLPQEAKEGDVVDFVDDRYVVNKEATGKRNEEIKKMTDGLFE